MKRTRVPALAVLLSTAVCALPAAAAASSRPTHSATSGSGGSGLTPAGSSSTSSNSGSAQNRTTPLPPTTPASVPVSTSGDGISLTTVDTAVLRRGITFSGTAPAGSAGDTVVIERSGRQTHNRWALTATGTVASNGTFTVVWTTNHIGRFAVRALLSTPEQVQAATASATSNATAPLTITVFRPSRATLYGPGFYGHRTACGERLRPGTIGVASRTLPCGTSVAILYGGRTLIVPVIDRGPYANGADWDLTMATGRALGITGTVQLAAVSLPTP
jgi:rare lipoprotein A